MLKIGYMEYANVFPIFYHLSKFDNLSFLNGYPSVLNRAIREGVIDISPSSSIEFARNTSNYKIIPDISISSIGAVKSVNVFSKYPINELSGKKIKFTHESNTSTVLCRIVLENFYNLKPIYTIEDDYDAELLIGDKALFHYYHPSMPYTIDLGMEWHKHTGLPFVFALWIVRSDLEMTSEFYEFLALLHKYSAKTNKYSRNLIDKYISKGYTEEQMIDYWNVIDYRLSLKHIEGLLLFYDYAYKNGEIKENPLSLLSNSFII